MKESCMTHNLQSNITEYINNKNSNRSEFIREEIDHFIESYSEKLLNLFNDENSLHINTIHIGKTRKDFIKKLSKNRIFPSMAESLRFILLFNILTNGIKVEEIPDEMDESIINEIESRIIRKLENPNGKKDYPFKPNQKPKNELNIYSHDLYKRLILSFLNENKWLDAKELGDLLGCDMSSITLILKRLKQAHPNLIVKRVVKKRYGNPYTYGINKDELKKLLEVA